MYEPMGHSPGLILGEFEALGRLNEVDEWYHQLPASEESCELGGGTSSSPEQTPLFVGVFWALQ